MHESTQGNFMIDDTEKAEWAREYVEKQGERLKTYTKEGSEKL